MVCDVLCGVFCVLCWVYVVCKVMSLVFCVRGVPGIFFCFRARGFVFVDDVRVCPQFVCFYVMRVYVRVCA